MVLKNPTCVRNDSDHVYAELHEPLRAADEFSTDFKVAKAKLLSREENGDLDCTDEEIEVVNRYDVSFRKCDRVLIHKVDDEWHVEPSQALPGVPGQSQDDQDICADVAGSSRWKVELNNGIPEWVLLESACCTTPLSEAEQCACESTTTTGEPGTSTTEDPCCQFEPAEPDIEITVEDEGLEISACCEARFQCTGNSQWSYNVSTGEWNLDSENCSTECVPRRPGICPNVDTCSQTDCVPMQCGTTTTPDPCLPGGTTTTDEPGTTTTCDPDCFEDSDGCIIEPPPCPENVCEWVCTASGFWVPDGPQSCAGFQIGFEGCSCNPLRNCTRRCVPPQGSECNFSNCGEVRTGRLVTSCPPAYGENCHGKCKWVNGGLGWIRYEGGCAGGCNCNFGTGCNCPAPDPVVFDPCDGPRYATSDCECLGGVDSDCNDNTSRDDCNTIRDDCCTEETTTTEEQACAGSCRWEWSDSSMTWSPIQNSCTGDNCHCVGEPAFDGNCDGQIQEGLCTIPIESTATTIAPTTTTTVEPTGCCRAPDNSWCLMATYDDCLSLGGMPSGVGTECAAYSVGPTELGYLCCAQEETPLVYTKCCVGTTSVWGCGVRCNDAAHLSILQTQCETNGTWYTNETGCQDLPDCTTTTTSTTAPPTTTTTPEPTGACCQPDGSCVDNLQQSHCPLPGQWMGSNTTCASVSCPTTTTTTTTPIPCTGNCQFEWDGFAVWTIVANNCSPAEGNPGDFPCGCCCPYPMVPGTVLGEHYFTNCAPSN